MAVVQIPDRILLSPQLWAVAKNIWGLLMMVRGPGASPDSPCKITQAQMAGFLRTTRITIRKNLRQLVAAEFLKVLGPGRYVPIDPELALQRAELEEVKAQLGRAELVGQGLMEVSCTVLVDDHHHLSNVRPDFLTNPTTGQLMEYDLYYPERRVAFEFNGPQHYRTTDKYSDEKALQDRMLRDLVKIGQSHRNNVKLITVNPGDLSIKGILALIGDSLPIRPGAAESLAAVYIDKACYHYRLKAQGLSDEPGPHEREGAIHQLLQGVSRVQKGPARKGGGATDGSSGNGGNGGGNPASGAPGRPP